MPPNRTIRAADARSLPAAQQVVDTVREAYLAQPGAMLISGVTLNPLEVLAVHASTGQSYRVPVTTRADGALHFGAPIRSVPGGAPSLPVAASGQPASRGPSDRDQQRIAAAVARGAIRPERAAFYATQAAAGHDITMLDHLGAVLPVAPGKVAAAASRQEPEDGEAEYRSLYGSVDDGQRVADARQVAAKAAVAAWSDDELYERMFGPGEARTAAPGAGPASERPAQDPLAARAAGRAGKHGRGTPPGTWNTPSRPYPPRP